MADAKAVRLLCLDVDGVLTDGGIMLDDRGVETKRFHVRDGTGIKLWMAAGREVAIITGRGGDVVKHRAAELGVEHVFQAVKDKRQVLEQLLAALREKTGDAIGPGETAFVGDDLPDLTVMQWVGYPIAVADGVAEIREVAAYTTERPGGQAAVREAIEHLMREQGIWEQTMASRVRSV